MYLINTRRKSMSSKTPQERLEIKEFILDANLFLISNSLYTVTIISLFMYYIICILFYQGNIDFFLFLSSTSIFILMMFFALIGCKSIYTQKKYIRRLDTVFEDIEFEDFSDEKQ